MKIDQVLNEYGQLLRPMSAAPKDGSRILAVSDAFGAVWCFWDPKPSRMITPCWVEERDAINGYLDRAFVGWYEPRRFRPLDRNAVYRLMVAYADEARDAGEPLKILDGPATREANDR